MKNLTYLLLALAVGSTALSAQSGSSPAQRVRAGVADLFPITHAIDLDGNGELSASEIAHASTMIFALDLDGDSTVSYSELHVAGPVNVAFRSAGRARPIETVMLALDANNDGELSMAEIANAAKSLAALDANKDGKISRNELRPQTTI
jgi:hypothetical protein